MAKKINIKYNKKHADIILQGLEAGLTLTDIINSNTLLPPRHIIVAWRKENPEFEAQYHISTKIRTEKWVDDLKSLCDKDIDTNMSKEDQYIDISKAQFKANTLKFLITHGSKASVEKVKTQVTKPKQVNTQIINYGVKELDCQVKSWPSLISPDNELVKSGTIY